VCEVSLRLSVWGLTQTQCVRSHSDSVCEVPLRLNVSVWSWLSEDTTHLQPTSLMTGRTCPPARCCHQSLPTPPQSSASTLSACDQRRSAPHPPANIHTDTSLVSSLYIYTINGRRLSVSEWGSRWRLAAATFTAAMLSSRSSNGEWRRWAWSKWVHTGAARRLAAQKITAASTAGYDWGAF